MSRKSRDGFLYRKHHPSIIRPFRLELFPSCEVQVGRKREDWPSRVVALMTNANRVREGLISRCSWHPKQGTRNPVREKAVLAITLLAF